jgi:hypothetical protein
MKFIGKYLGELSKFQKNYVIFFIVKGFFMTQLAKNDVSSARN